jgi:hypothetical protein
MPYTPESAVDESLRSRIIGAICDALRPREDVLAAWEGGSAAFGTLDAYSDVDVNVLVSDSAPLEGVHRVVEAALTSVSPVTFSHPAPPGRYYKLSDGGPYLFVDVCLFRAGTSDRHLDVERHGFPRILFDKGDWLRVPALNVEVVAERCSARCAELRTWFATSESFVRKEVSRGREVDALSAFWGYTLRPLADILRLTHCPVRWDFGMRYLDRDLPPDVYQRFRSLAFVQDNDDLAGKLDAAVMWGSALLNDLAVDVVSWSKRVRSGAPAG